MLLDSILNEYYITVSDSIKIKTYVFLTCYIDLTLIHMNI